MQKDRRASYETKGEDQPPETSSSKIQVQRHEIFSEERTRNKRGRETNPLKLVQVTQGVSPTEKEWGTSPPAETQQERKRNNYPRTNDTG